MAKLKYSVGIIGLGMVGGALENYFKTINVKPFVYDTYKGLGSPAEVNKAEFIFICVPTPYDKKKGFDDMYVDASLALIETPHIVVIKSTVVPGTTERFQKKYPQHTILFNPEFLVEANAMKDMLEPDRQIIGYTEKSFTVAKDILALLPSAPFEEIVSATEAEMVKYFGNTFLAMKVIFGNQMFDLCEKLGISYERVAECASADKRIGPSHLDVLHGGYRGYGGKCLPKDIRALIQFADRQKVDLSLHKAVEKHNNKLMRQQKIKDPEKFSIRT